MGHRDEQDEDDADLAQHYGRCPHEWCVEQGEEPEDDREVCMLCGAVSYPERS